MKKTAIIIISVFFALTASWALADDARKKRILYVNSYHKGYEWSDGIFNSAMKKFGVSVDSSGNLDNSKSKVTLKVTYMDTKRNQTEEYKKEVALKIKKMIETWKPDLVITSDDNAVKYVIVPYFKNTSLPFVFSGVGGDAAGYGFPFSNVTGMLELQLVDQIIATMKKYARGERIGYIKGDDFTARKESSFFEERFNIKLDKRFVKNFAQWQQQYKKLQNEADMIILGNYGSIPDWNADQAKKIIYANTTVPTGSWDYWMAPYSLITYATISKESGEWVAEKSLEILNGKAPADIPIVTNKKAKIYLNMKLAKRLGIKFPMELIENAHLISAEQKKMFYVNSYHKGYEWSDDIEKGLLKALDIRENSDGTYDTSGSDVELKVFRMDTKLNKSEAFKKQAALKAKAIIDEWKPDIVVASDDNASKYLIAPYYKNGSIPFVFCGLNWDASVYGFPVSNVTGMVEIDPVLETIEILKKYAKGNRIGFIGVKSISARKSVDTYVKRLGIKISDGKLVSDFSEWKKEYLRLQDSVDMILWFNPVGITGWDSKSAEAFILENTKIPTGATADNNKRFAMIGIVKIAEEQGWWAGKTALRILDGKSPADIPVVTNKESRVYLNMPLAKRLGIKFSMELIEKATFIENPRD